MVYSMMPSPMDDLSHIKFVAIFYLIYMLVVLAAGVAVYVLQSLGLYTISKRRGIKKPWLSWLPVGNMWILGCISDQYQYVVKGAVKNKRKALLVLNILMWSAYIIFYVLFGMFFAQMLYYEDPMLWADDPAMAGFVGTAAGMLGMGLVMMGLAIALVVIQYIALYDLYSSCEPKNNLLYLLLSIFVNITMPVLLFVCRKKDLGMPPRKPEPVTYIPQEPPVETPVWQPAEPPAEPWENVTEE